MESEKIKIEDNYGFLYEIALEYKPHFGFGSAVYDGSIIGTVELGRILPPSGDDDREWEQYEERFSEWKDEIKVNIIPICNQYFNSKKL